MIFDEWPDQVDDVPRVQEMLLEFPPIYAEIAAVFRLHEYRDIVFSFGPQLYNPYGISVQGDIIAHEAVHGARQGDNPQDTLDWWQRYMKDPAFRLSEEIYAHRAEYRWLREHGDRHQRRGAGKRVATKLASPLYGKLLSVAMARKILEAPNYHG